MVRMFLPIMMFIGFLAISTVLVTNILVVDMLNQLVPLIVDEAQLSLVHRLPLVVYFLGFLTIIIAIASVLSRLGVPRYWQS